MGTTSNVQSNHGIEVFLENQFFVFWGTPKNFFGPKSRVSKAKQGFGGSKKFFAPIQKTEKRGKAKSGLLDRGVSVTQPPMDQLT